MAVFPSKGAGQMLRILKKIGYRVSRQEGSHRVMTCPQRPDILFSYHGNVTVPPGVVRKILVKDVGLTEQDALKLL